MLTGKRLTQSLARTWTHGAAQWDLGQTLPVLFLVFGSAARGTFLGAVGFGVSSAVAWV